MAFVFEKLFVYQQAVGFADNACTLTKGFPRGYPPGRVNSDPPRKTLYVARP